MPPIQEYIPVAEEPKQKDKKPRKPFPVLTLILGLLLVASLALSVYLYLGWQDALQAYEICEDQLEDTQEEYDEAHIPGAIVIPNTEIEARAESELPDKDQMILVYCRSGRRSKLAADILVELGYTNIYEFGGIIDWPYETE